MLQSHHYREEGHLDDSWFTPWQNPEGEFEENHLNFPISPFYSQSLVRQPQTIYNGTPGWKVREAKINHRPLTRIPVSSPPTQSRKETDLKKESKSYRHPKISSSITIDCQKRNIARKVNSLNCSKEDLFCTNTVLCLKSKSRSQKDSHTIHFGNHKGNHKKSIFDGLRPQRKKRTQLNWGKPKNQEQKLLYSTKWDESRPLTKADNFTVKRNYLRLGLSKKVVHLI